MFVITLVGGILSKIENVAKFIFSYSPIPENIIKFIIFSILIFIPLRILYQYLKHNFIEKIAQLIVTPPILKLFINNLESIEKKVEFNELDVYNFISKINYPENKILRIFFETFFLSKSHTVLNSLKDLFIYNMLSKQLIEISRADKLDRNFKIIKGYYHLDMNDDDLPF